MDFHSFYILPAVAILASRVPPPLTLFTVHAILAAALAFLALVFVPVAVTPLAVFAADAILAF